MTATTTTQATSPAMEFSIVYPAYNEELNIREAMARSLAALRPLFTRFEIVVVNDGSRDATGRIADELASQHPEIRVIHNERNLGGGAAFLRGLEQTRGAIVSHNAMDYPFDLCDLPRMLPLLDDADIVVARRTSREAYGLYRKLTSVVNVTLLNLLFGLHLHDYNFIQVYKRAVLDRVRVDTRSTLFITPELMIRAHDLGFRIAEVPIPYYRREHGVATSGRPRVILRSLRDMFSFWLKRRREHAAQSVAPST